MKLDTRFFEKPIACWNIRALVILVALALAFTATLAHAIAPVCDPEGDDTWQTAQEVMLNGENVDYSSISCDGAGGVALQDDDDFY